MGKHFRGAVIAAILILTTAPMLAGCVVAAGPGWGHGYWYHGRHYWYR